MNAAIDEGRFGPWAVVTGASSGIGREIARQVAASRINVVLVARRRQLLEEIGRGLTKTYGVEHRILGADAADPGFMRLLAFATEDIDVGLVASNAGTAETGAFLKRDLADLQYFTRLNAISHMEIAHHFGRRLVKRGRGGLLLSGAMGAMHGLPYMANDSASKAYVQTLGEALHVELGASGVTVTVLVIGPTDTAVVPKLGLDPRKMPVKLMSPEQCAFEGLSALAAGRSKHVSGRMNRVMNAVMPASLVRRMMATMLGEAAARSGARKGGEITRL